MAGINRLGRGAAKPGTLRPTDPNRFKTEDFFSVDAEDDPEYLRRVVEVEQLAAQKAGSVLAKGAFDKGDALYIRDEAEKSRHKELELRDEELGAFARMRTQLDQRAGIGDDDLGPSLKKPKMIRPKITVKKGGTSAPSQVDSKEPTAAAEAENALDPKHKDTANASGASVSAKGRGLSLAYGSSSEDDSA